MKYLLIILFLFSFSCKNNNKKSAPTTATVSCDVVQPTGLSSISSNSYKGLCVDYIIPNEAIDDIEAICNGKFNQSECNNIPQGTTGCKYINEIDYTIIYWLPGTISDPKSFCNKMAPQLGKNKSMEIIIK